MDVTNQIAAITKSVLNVNVEMDSNTKLLGDLPEFDSQAVLTVMTEIEEHFGIFFEDDEVSADIFESIGTLSAFVGKKL